MNPLKSVEQCVTKERMFGSVGKQDASDRDRCTKIHRPPRIVVSCRVDTTLVRFHRDRVLVAVDRLPRRKRAVIRVGVHATHESWSVECQVEVIHSFHCNRRSSSLSRINISSVVVKTLTRSCATADRPRDALCQSKSCRLLHNCRNKLYSKSTANRSNGVRGLQLTDVTCSNQPRLVDCRIGVINRIDRRRVLLTTRSTCRGEVFKSRVSDKVPEGCTLILEIHDFLKTQCGIGGGKHPCQKQPDSSTVSIQCRLVPDGQTKRHATITNAALA